MIVRCSVVADVSVLHLRCDNETSEAASGARASRNPRFFVGFLPVLSLLLMVKVALL